MKKKAIEIPEQTDFSPKAFKKLQRELALARAQIAYLKELEALDRQKQRQKKEKSLKDWSQITRWMTYFVWLKCLVLPFIISKLNTIIVR